MPSRYGAEVVRRRCQRGLLGRHYALHRLVRSDRLRKPQGVCCHHHDGHGVRRDRAGRLDCRRSGMRSLPLHKTLWPGCRRATTAKPTRNSLSKSPTLARQAKQHEADRDGAEVKLSTAQNTIRDRLREHGVRHIESENVSALWSTVKGRQSWDHAGICEAAAARGGRHREIYHRGRPHRQARDQNCVAKPIPRQGA